jgi:hypothetical protein
MSRVTFLFIGLLLLQSCIGEDVLEDLVEERLVVINPVASLNPNENYQLSIRFFNNVGAEEFIPVNYNSSDEAVATINSVGLINTLQEGQTTISAQVLTPEGIELTESFLLTITNGQIEDTGPTEGFGTIRTTSSYILEGGFLIRELPETGSVRIEVDETYRADTDLPGLYVYLTNNPSSPANALEIGPVEIFSGSHQYTISDTRLKDYNYLLYWCKPFEVKVGDAQIETE